MRTNQDETAGGIVQKYRTLPEAARVPDIVWTVQGTLDRLRAIDAERRALSDELLAQSVEMMRVLRRDWSESDLRAAGLISEAS